MLSFARDPLTRAAAFIALLLSTPVAWAVTELRQTDFHWGSYIIDKPGKYRLAEDIRFRPNSPGRLSRAIASGKIPAAMATRLGLPTHERVPAHLAATPLASQFRHGPAGGPFQPGGPLDANYDPAAFGLGFFAAIVIAADDVELDLNGYKIEQSREHALLQRFFAVIELASAPFIPSQGPHDFGDRFKAAERVIIKNGTIGRSAHHGIHGNGNKNVKLRNLRFDGFEVAAVALNGVDGLHMTNVRARNRKGVPVLGTFSAAQFIKPYLTHLVRTGSETTLTVQGEPLTPSVALAALNEAIDRVHSDVLVTGRIDGARHPASYGLFHNKPGLVDGNGYGFLLNPLGVAVNGFPTSQATQPSQHLRLHNVHIDRLHGFINEVVALNSGGGATIDPVGAVWQLFNIHPDTGVPLTVTELSGEARYSGNVLANAQALVAKAIHAGDFNNAHLSTRRANITPAMLAWVEARPGAETLAAALPEQNRYLCNGDSMFHVNKGMVGFKLDGAQRGLLTQTSVRNVRNFGAPGSDLCGDYRNGKSHQLATLPGYGGARIRGYSLAGSKAWALLNASARNLLSTSGDVFGVDALTDSRQLWLANTRLTRLTAGDASAAGVNAPNLPPEAAGMKIGADTQSIVSINLCARKLTGVAGAQAVDDKSGSAFVRQRCSG